MDWKEFMPWAFQAMLGGCIVYGVAAMNKLRDKMEEINKNVQEVIKNQATQIEKSSWHEREIYKMDVRLDRLESK